MGVVAQISEGELGGQPAASCRTGRNCSSNLVMKRQLSGNYIGRLPAIQGPAASAVPFPVSALSSYRRTEITEIFTWHVVVERL